MESTMIYVTCPDKKRKGKKIHKEICEKKCPHWKVSKKAGEWQCDFKKKLEKIILKDQESDSCDRMCKLITN